MKKGRLILPSGSSRRGAQMGRADEIPDIPPSAHPKLRMERLRWVDGDYDESGAYWGYGTGSSVYCAHGEHDGEPIRIYTRAHNRTEAKAEVREVLPAARFYR